MFDPISSRAPLTLYLIWFIAQEESFPCTRQPSSDVPFKEKARQKLIVIVVVARCHQILYRNGAASGDLKCVTPPFARIYLCVYVCVCGCYLCAHAHCSPGAYTHTRLWPYSICLRCTGDRFVNSCCAIWDICQFCNDIVVFLMNAIDPKVVSRMVNHSISFYHHHQTPKTDDLFFFFSFE